MYSRESAFAVFLFFYYQVRACARTTSSLAFLRHESSSLTDGAVRLTSGEDSVREGMELGYDSLAHGRGGLPPSGKSRAIAGERAILRAAAAGNRRVRA
jgi:hypothetical protein